MTTSQTNDEKVNGAGTAAAAAARRTIATYPDYAAAERAVDYLSDQGFAVERTAIVGKDLRSVEQVEGRMSAGRAALVGLGEGALIGTLFALLFGVFFTRPAFGGLLLYSILTGGLFGTLFGTLSHIMVSDGKRDFVSDTSITADRYEVQVDDGVADEAERLARCPARDEPMSQGACRA
jgi:uncharacterized membrane protein